MSPYGCRKTHLRWFSVMSTRIPEPCRRSQVVTTVLKAEIPPALKAAQRSPGRTWNKANAWWLRNLTSDRHGGRFHFGYRRKWRRPLASLLSLKRGLPERNDVVEKPGTHPPLVNIKESKKMTTNTSTTQINWNEFRHKCAELEQECSNLEENISTQGDIFEDFERHCNRPGHTDRDLEKNAV